MGRLWAGGKASQPSLELIEAGHIKSLCRRPSALVPTAGSWKPSPRPVCVRGITASFTRTSGGLCTALRIRSTPRNSGSDSRRTVRSERSRPRHQLGAVVQEWTLSAYCRSRPTPPPRSYRDRNDYAMEAARLIKSKNPHSMVEVKDLQSGDVTAVALRPG